MRTETEIELAAALDELERKRGELRALEERIEVLKCKCAGSAMQPDSEGLRKTKPGVQYRKGKQEKGGVYGAGCYEETMWDPKIIMPSLGIRPVGHIRTCFPRKNGMRWTTPQSISYSVCRISCAHRPSVYNHCLIPTMFIVSQAVRAKGRSVQRRKRGWILNLEAIHNIQLRD